MTPTSGPTEDCFEEYEFAMAVGGTFFITASRQSKSVCLTYRRNGTERIFEVTPEQAESIALALKAVAACVRGR
jgi:hypothetical protein